MRNLSRLILPLFAVFAIVFSTGCGDDTPGIGDVVLDPMISLDPAAGFVSGDSDIDLNAPTFSVRVRGNEGDSPLRDLRIEENGTNIPSSRLAIVGIPVVNNPLLIPDADDASFTYDVTISGYAGAAESVTYNFVVTDDDNEAASESFDINYTQAGPDVELLVGDGLVSSDATVNSFAGIFRVALRSTPTGANIREILVLEDDVALEDTQVVLIDGDSVRVGNPLVFGGDGRSEAATDSIRINPIGTTIDSRSYTFRVTDVNGVSTDFNTVITFDTPAGTPISSDTIGFFNASGANNGGLDLDAGMAVPYNSADAEIQDEGINLALPNTQERWRRQISAAGDDVEIKLVDLASLGDGTDFSSIQFLEEIQEAFDGGTDLDGDDDFEDTEGDDSDDEEVSQPLNGGDANNEGEVFAVKRGERLYLVQFIEVLPAFNTSGNFDQNTDEYRVRIKR